jgi:hypothetical protein
MPVKTIFRSPIQFGTYDTNRTVDSVFLTDLRVLKPDMPVKQIFRSPDQFGTNDTNRTVDPYFQLILGF